MSVSLEWERFGRPDVPGRSGGAHRWRSRSRCRAAVRRVTGVTRNLSQEGAFVATRRPPSVGELVTLRLSVPGNAVPLSVDAEVRWLRRIADPRPARWDRRLVRQAAVRRVALHRLVAARARANLPPGQPPTGMWSQIRSVAIAAGLLVMYAGGVAHATEVGYSRKYGVGCDGRGSDWTVGKIWVGQTNAIDMGLGFYGYGYRGGCYRDRDGRDICERRFGHGSTSFHVDYLGVEAASIAPHSSTGTSAWAGASSSAAIRAPTIAGTRACARQSGSTDLPPAQLPRGVPGDRARLLLRARHVPGDGGGLGRAGVLL